MSLKPATLAGLEQRLRDHAGLEPPKWVVETRGAARIEALGVSGEEYLQILDSTRGPSELAALVESVRVGETRFFRHKAHVDALLEVVIPAWRAREEKRPRIWSAGCASGEEPYTLALVLAQAMPKPMFTPSILATDVSKDAIDFARRGTYPRAALDRVPEPYKDGFAIEGDRAVVRADVKSLVRFEVANLASADRPRGFDLVWCRNVLIYFEAQARKCAIDKLVDALEPGGFMFVGYSETLRDVAALRAVAWRDQVLYEKPDRVSIEPPKSREAPRESRTSTPRASFPGLPPESKRQEEARASKVPRSNDADRSKARTLHITKSDLRALATEVGDALATPGLTSLTVDLDAADFLSDEAAPIFRRACAVAKTAGISLVLRASKPGAQRWLRRHGLAGGDA